MTRQVDITCKTCGTVVSKRLGSKYCSIKCRTADPDWIEKIRIGATGNTSRRVDISIYAPEIERLYQENHSPRQIANYLKVKGAPSQIGATIIKNHLCRLGIASGKHCGTFTCKACQKELLASGWNQKYCKTCIPNKAAGHRFLARGLTQQMWNAMLDTQCNACAICKTVFDFSKGNRRKAGVFVDHDHQTGKTRGVLCPGCNHALGWIEKDSWLNAALQYLDEHTLQPTTKSTECSDSPSDQSQSIRLVQNDCIDFLVTEKDNTYDVIFIDPPFNTGKRQSSTREALIGYDDSWDNLEAYLQFMHNVLREAHRVLKKSGTLYVLLDWRSAFDVKRQLDSIFGRDNFLNHIVWAFDFGGRGKDRFPRKSNDILAYTKSMGDHVFNWDDVDRIPYMAPGLCGPEKAERGKFPTNVWWFSIVGTNSKERTGYPTQKPCKLVERAIRASCPKGGLVLDFFAGSGTTGQAALNAGCRAILVDSNPQAIEVMKTRFPEHNLITL